MRVRTSSGTGRHYALLRSPKIEAMFIGPLVSTLRSQKLCSQVYFNYLITGHPARQSWTETREDKICTTRSLRNTTLDKNPKQFYTTFTQHDNGRHDPILRERTTVERKKNTVEYMWYVMEFQTARVARRASTDGVLRGPYQSARADDAVCIPLFGRLVIIL